MRHFVDGFPRCLPITRKASEKQKDLARERGVILLPGETFVKHYLRGKQKTKEELDGNSKLDSLPFKCVFGTVKGST